jgi:glutamate-5-semialdehyde dehydrogenase
MTGIARRARAASRALLDVSTLDKNNALVRMAERILEAREEIRAANAKDLEAGRAAGLSEALLDRLELTDKRIDGMADALRNVAHLKDPVGAVLDGWTLPNGLQLSKVRCPIGVVFIIYESRPNVTADAASLCLKSGNACILRGGKESIQSNLAIHRILAAACAETGLPADAIQLIETTDRAAVPVLLKLSDLIDVVVPRGGKGLIQAVVENSTIPVVKHYEGICHTYVDASADLEMALEICFNAKCQRPGTCNAMETLLVHEQVAGEFLPRMAERFREAGVELRGCERTRAILPDAAEATEEDWRTEYLALILSIRVVGSLDEAIEHINQYGSAHSDAIVTRDFDAAQAFCRRVDSATVYVNASTRFTDGGQFGLGAEIGISTDKLHARGPMALEELTSYKWIVLGSGQLRS